MKADHVVIKFDVAPNRFLCERCGDSVAMPFDCSLDYLSGCAGVFMGLHKDCEAHKEGEGGE